MRARLVDDPHATPTCLSPSKAAGDTKVALTPPPPTSQTGSDELDCSDDVAEHRDLSSR